MLSILKELLKPRTIFAAMFYAAFIFLVINGKDIPDVLTSIVLTLLGFYFGQRTKKESQK